MIERLASDSEDLAARIDYLTDPDTATKTLQRRIASLRNGTRFIDYAACREIAAEIDGLASDIETDILPRDPPVALDLAEKLFSLDQKIFNRADDSDGLIGDSLRSACEIWLKAAAATRATEAAGGAGQDWAAVLQKHYESNDYGVREPLMREANLLLTEAEIRALAARFEAEALQVLERARSGDRDFVRVFSPSTAIGMLAESLRDPALYEHSIRIYSPEPNELQSEDIAKHYLECGDATGALRWLQGDWEKRFEFQKLDLLDRAYALLGDTARQIEVRRKRYHDAPGIGTFRSLSELLPEDARAELRASACAEASTYADVANAAEMLFALGEPALAAEIISDRAAQLEGGNYFHLPVIAQMAKKSGAFLAATIVWRALLENVLARAYARAYHHAADYLHEMRAVAPAISDYRGHMTHEKYEESLKAKHGRKSSFWAQVSGRR